MNTHDHLIQVFLLVLHSLLDFNKKKSFLHTLFSLDTVCHLPVRDKKMPSINVLQVLCLTFSSRDEPLFNWAAFTSADSIDLFHASPL